MDPHEPPKTCHLSMPNFLRTYKGSQRQKRQVRLTIRVAVVGVGVRGKEGIKWYHMHPHAQRAYIYS